MGGGSASVTKSAGDLENEAANDVTSAAPTCQLQIGKNPQT